MDKIVKKELGVWVGDYCDYLEKSGEPREKVGNYNKLLCFVCIFCELKADKKLTPSEFKSFIKTAEDPLIQMRFELLKSIRRLQDENLH